jgi:hypothetical protein
VGCWFLGSCAVTNLIVGASWEAADQGPFTLRPLVEQTRDSSNLIGGERKFVRSAFTLEANGQGSPKCLHGSTF